MRLFILHQFLLLFILLSGVVAQSIPDLLATLPDCSKSCFPSIGSLCDPEDWVCQCEPVNMLGYVGRCVISKCNPIDGVSTSQITRQVCSIDLLNPSSSSSSISTSTSTSTASSTSTESSTSTSTPAITSTSSATPLDEQTPDSKPTPRLNTAAISGITVGSISFVALLGLGMWLWGRTFKKSREMHLKRLSMFQSAPKNPPVPSSAMLQKAPSRYSTISQKVPSRHSTISQKAPGHYSDFENFYSAMDERTVGIREVPVDRAMGRVELEGTKVDAS